MKSLKITLSITLLSALLWSFTTITTTKYKCMIQMTNYTGEGAYVVVSLINPNGDYDQTLFVQGDDEEWYYDITQWWKFQGKVRADIDAITGATIAGGERAINVLDIDDSKINKGYKLRFETAVEDQEYYTKDIEFDLTTENLKAKHDGKGFIRYVRLMPN